MDCEPKARALANAYLALKDAQAEVAARVGSLRTSDFDARFLEARKLSLDACEAAYRSALAGRVPGARWPGRYGEPQDPVRGGWHWVVVPGLRSWGGAIPLWWTNCSWEHPLADGSPDTEWSLLFDGLMDAEDVPQTWRYLGPCLCPYSLREPDKDDGIEGP